MASLPCFSGRAQLDSESGIRAKHYKKINQYVLLSLLGEGSFAKVYLGLDPVTRYYNAVKQVKLQGLSRTCSGISQLEEEIQLMRELRHPNILSLREVIHVPKLNTVYMVIEYADCGSLSSIMESGYTFGLDECRRIFRQIVRGVSYLHSRNVVHQDLKPSNIMMKSDGQVLIADFGIGHSFQSAAVSVGTPAYQAPEVIDEGYDDVDIDPGKEDVWSLGVTFYEMTFHELPFDGANVFEIVRSITMSADYIEPPNECDPDLWDLIKGMLQVDPKNRLGIQEVAEHRFFGDEEDDISCDFLPTPMPIPEFNQKIPIEQIKGTVCTPGYRFSQAENQSLKHKFKSFRPPKF